VVLAVAVALAYTAGRSNDNTEHRLLRQQLRQASTALQSSATAIARTLDAAAVAAAAPTQVNTAAFSRIISPLVGNGAQFVSVTLWNLTDDAPLAAIGDPSSVLGLAAGERRALLERARPAELTVETRFAAGSGGRFGYATADVDGPTRLVVYAESALPRDRTAVRQRTDPYRSVDYALYLGTRPDHDRLLIASGPPASVHGTREQLVVPFGDTRLLLVFVAREALAGPLSDNLRWFILAAGVLAGLVSGLAVELLARRRDRALVLASENEVLYAEQRDIASSLQRSLQPRAVDDSRHIRLAARYEPAVGRAEIGGDWYDVVPLDGGRRIFVTVGDVSGHGLPAAATMASVRFAARAYAVDGDGPAVVLGKLSRLLDVGDDCEFATVLCALVDLDARTLVLANAGHPSPLLVEGGTSRFVEVPPGPPIGVGDRDSYQEMMVAIGAEGVFLAFTDGLFERRGEPIDDSLARLQSWLGEAGDGDVEEMVATMARHADEHEDDLAIVGVQWPMTPLT
jgi:hypothetical protein